MEHVGHFAEWLYPPHAVCWRWNWSLITLHLVSDILIALAYFAIPLALIYLVRCYRAKRMSKVLLLYGAFIFLCGATHVMGAITIWHPYYWLEGWLKALTALASMAAAIVTIWMFKAILSTLRKLADLQGRVERRIEQLQHDARYSQEADKEATATLIELKGVVERVLSYAPTEAGKV